MLASKLLVKPKAKGARRTAVPPHHTPQLLLQIRHTVLHSLTRRKKENGELKAPYEWRLDSILYSRLEEALSCISNGQQFPFASYYRVEW